MSRKSEDYLDLDFLLHPSQAFDTPAEVVRDPDLTLNEKRAILASWASDACAVGSRPALRKTPQGRVVTFDEIAEALRGLDKQAATAKPPIVVNPFSRRRARSRRSPPSSHSLQ